MAAKPQLVCPAGSLAALKAAVDNGADDVYLGFRNDTNARNFAGLNFDEKSLVEGVRYAHQRGRRVLAAINTYAQAGRFADLAALVRFALEQQPVLAPFAESVSERLNEWLMDKAQTGPVFSAEQLAWLNLIRDHIATAISIEPEDLDLTPFNQRGGLGKAHQLFGEQLPKLLDELNEVLAA